MNAVINRDTTFINLGVTDYQQAWNFQTGLFEKILAVKSANRNLPEDEQAATTNYLIFVQHPHVFTLGKSGDQKNLLISEEELQNLSATYHHINRGGDITYHGPGQLVGYPVIDLENFFTDIHQYMRLLEESVIRTLAEYGIVGTRIPGLTGVWMVDSKGPRKICALGVKTSRWVTLHGFALNVNTNLQYFDYIVPCGIDDKAVTSMEKELGAPQDMNAVSARLKYHIGDVFGMLFSTEQTTAPTA